MTAATLKRIAMAHNWTPEEWHLKLADRIPPTAVLHIFRTAVLRDSFTWLGEHLYAKYLELEDPAKRKAAMPYLPDLARAIGFPVHIVQPPPQPAGTVRQIFTTEEEIEAARKRRAIQKRNAEDCRARLNRGYHPEETREAGVKQHMLSLRKKLEVVTE